MKKVSLIAFGVIALCVAVTGSDGRNERVHHALAIHKSPASLAAQAPHLPIAETTAVTMAMPERLEDKFLGAMTCAGPACHGRPAPTERTRSQQTEFTTWSTKDKHHEAFHALANDKSVEIARHLKLATAPHESDRCLNCHSMNVLDPARRGQDFKLSDGVSCDGCHGPAERWLGTHLNEPYAESLKKGMKDIRDPVLRAEICVSCHVGDRLQGKVVDHEMLAAGHPPLDFELDAFSRRMPQHWREQTDSGTKRAHVWAVGQVVSLQAAARLLVSDASKGRWPEYSHFDCATCHHDLNEDGWRLMKPPGRLPGRPIWAATGSAGLVRKLIEEKPLVESLDLLDSYFVHVPFGKPENVAEGAKRLDVELAQLIRVIQDRPLSKEDAHAVAIRLCEAVEPIAWCGPAAAQQLTFALASLASVLHSPDSPTITAVNELQSDLAAGSGYNPGDFVRRVAVIRQQL